MYKAHFTNFCKSVTRISDVIWDVNLFVVVFMGIKKTFLSIENIFWTNKNVFLSPLKKQKQLSDEYLSKIMYLLLWLWLWQTNKTRL